MRVTFPWPSIVSGEAQEIPTDQVVVYGGRAQSLDQRLLDELVESIAHDGLQTPIVVRRRRPPNEGYALISGLHRLRAYQVLWEQQTSGKHSKPRVRYDVIPAIVMSAEMTVDECKLWELVENTKRRQFDTKTRAAMATRIQRLRRKVWPQEDSATGTDSAASANGTEGAPRINPWFKRWYREGAIPKRSAMNLWSRFKSETGQDDATTPGSAAGAALAEQFEAWTAAAEGKRIQAAADKKAEQKRRKAAADKKARLDDLRKALTAVLTEDGEAEALIIVRELLPVISH